MCVFETGWDRQQLEATRAAWGDRYAVEFAAPSDVEATWDEDVAEWAREQTRRRPTIAGVFSSSDYPGATAAAAVAAELGLAGPRPRDVMRASHKFLSRQLQLEVVPEAVPPFALVDPDEPGTWDPKTGFPCFVKPVKGAFSVMAQVVRNRAELEALMRSQRVAWFRSVFVSMFDRLAAHYDVELGARYFIAEGLLHGAQVTVECWRSRASAGVLGVVDSTFAPGTRSFVSFDYPSVLPASVQERMGELALAVGEHLRLDQTLFNVEMTWNPATGRIGIVEINPRACGQFGDLYHKVDGTSGYEVLLTIAAGEEPPARRAGGEFRAAASFPLRVFRPTLVERAPDAEHTRQVLLAHPGSLAWIECNAGDELAGFGEFEDGESHRYAVLNLGGDDRADLLQRLQHVRDDLGFELEPMAPKD